MMTNNHVLNKRTDLSQSICIFDYNEVKALIEQRQPTKLLHTDPVLDYSLVELEPSSKPGRAIIPLHDEAINATRCISIGHPAGGPKKLSILKNEVVNHPSYDRAHDSILYSTDTVRGSSGSPIFAPDWKLVALHRGEAQLTQIEGVVNVGTKLYNIMEDIRLNKAELATLVCPPLLN
eukprot:TRINITY_DN10910_c0_g1_i1.p1 TRINITY_DN10910_c0_g1~~TRINITY_DN10910_c0_g1_i1.p1  ORF type:complete len:178 (+),score=28.58 TRINITY_DN10910_c0_g1_i1:417-950(+)